MIFPKIALASLQPNPSMYYPLLFHSYPSGRRNSFLYSIRSHHHCWLRRIPQWNLWNTRSLLRALRRQKRIRPSSLRSPRSLASLPIRRNWQFSLASMARSMSFFTFNSHIKQMFPTVDEMNMILFWHNREIKELEGSPLYSKFCVTFTVLTN